MAGILAGHDRLGLCGEGWLSWVGFGNGNLALREDLCERLNPDGDEKIRGPHQCGGSGAVGF